MIDYFVYTLTNSTPHQFLKPGQCGVNYRNFLITTNEIEGLTKFKTYVHQNIKEGDLFYIKVAFDNRGKKASGKNLNTGHKKLSLEEAKLKIEGAFGIQFEILDAVLLIAPDQIRETNVKNCFEIYGKITQINSWGNLIKNIKTGIGSRKSYGFGQMVLINEKENMEDLVCQK